MSHSAFSSRRVVCQTCEIWVDNNNHKLVPILANLCCLEANLVSNCRKKNFFKCLYNLLGYKIINFLSYRQKNRCPSYFLEVFIMIKLWYLSRCKTLAVPHNEGFIFHKGAWSKEWRQRKPWCVSAHFTTEFYGRYNTYSWGLWISFHQHSSTYYSSTISRLRCCVWASPPWEPGSPRRLCMSSLSAICINRNLQLYHSGSIFSLNCTTYI